MQCYELSQIQAKRSKFIVTAEVLMYFLIFFLYFFNPHTTMGCYECELMDNNWKHVMDAYEGSVNMVVAEIDCAEEEDLCADEFHVQVRSMIS